MTCVAKVEREEKLHSRGMSDEQQWNKIMFDLDVKRPLFVAKGRDAFLSRLELPEM